MSSKRMDALWTSEWQQEVFREAKVKFGASFVLNGVVTDEGNVLKDNYSNLLIFLL